MAESNQEGILPNNTMRESSTGENREKGIKQDCNYRGRARLFNWVGLAGGLIGIAAMGSVIWERSNPPLPSPEQIQQIKPELKNEFADQLNAEMENPELYKTKFGIVVHNQRITMSGLCDILIKVSKGEIATQDDCFRYLDQRYHAQGGQ